MQASKGDPRAARSAAPRCCPQRSRCCASGSPNAKATRQTRCSRPPRPTSAAIRRHGRPDHHRRIRPPQQRHHRQQHVRHPAPRAPRPTRPSPQRTLRTTQHPRPRMPPTPQHPRTPRTGQPPGQQPLLDARRIRLYRVAVPRADRRAGGQCPVHRTWVASNDRLLALADEHSSTSPPFARVRWPCLGVIAVREATRQTPGADSPP